MSDIANNQDDFTRSAGRQLALFAALSVSGIALLMMGLSWASSLTGSGGVSEGVDPATGTVTLALREEPPQLDSTLSTDQVSGMVLGHVMEGLLRYDAHNHLAPGVAERWEVTDSGATFWLREDARWSDGQPVTADDFVFSWRRAVDPANASEYASIMFPIANAEAINQGEMDVDELGVRAVDDRTLVVDLERPVPYFDKLTAFSTYYPIREAFYRATKGRYAADADKLLYNGPFTITRWVHGAHVRMEKNPEYWNRERIQIQVLDFPYVTQDPNASLNLFKDGKIAYTTLTEENLTEALVQRWDLNRFMDGSVFYMEFNFREGRITRNLNLRKAIQAVLDPAELVYRVIKLPGYLPGESLFPIWLQGEVRPFRQEYPPPPRITDPERGRDYLEQARRELGLDEFPPLVLLTGDSPISNKQAEYYQETLNRELGLEVRIDRQIFKQRLAKMTAGDFDMVMAGWGPDFDDPLTFGDLFASWNLNNRGRYSNPELDSLVRVAQNTTDQRVRMEAFGEIQRILLENAVILPDYERGLVYVVDPQLKGMVRRVVGPDPDLTNVRIVEG
ncbi:MAG: peptide ABC transporter substrate-binding protein [Pseudomonadales bacterium]